MLTLQVPFSSVYGPVQSWRFGRSLGIDPVGPNSVCSFKCVYCQLGQIEHQTCKRDVFVSTDQILSDLQAFYPWDVDIITLSGSGEPTLALNLGDILTRIKAQTNKPIAVLTNGSLLSEASVRNELAIADHVAIKFDAISADQLKRTNNPIDSIEFHEIWIGIRQFRWQYQGTLAIQTMMLSPWDDLHQMNYVSLMQTLAPDEIQLNTPTRPKPLVHSLEARGNHHSTVEDGAKSLKTVAGQDLKDFGDRIQSAIGIPVRYPDVG